MKLPRNAPYISRIPTGDITYGYDRDVDIWAYVRNDPDFGFMFVRSFCDLNMALPADVYEHQLWRMFCFKRHRDNSYDHNLLEAYTITHPKMAIVRTILECMLLHPDIPFPVIAATLEYDPDVIDLYHELFYNVRGRFTGKDDPYLLSLVYSESRQVEFVPDYHLKEDWRLLAKRIAYNKGLKTMLQWLGSMPADSEFDGAESMHAIEASIMSSARFAIKVGFQHQTNMAAIHSARQVLQSSKLAGQDTGGDDDLMRIGKSEAAMRTLKAMVTSNAHDLLKRQQMYDRSIADALEKSRQAAAVDV